MVASRHLRDTLRSQRATRVMSALGSWQIHVCVDTIEKIDHWAACEFRRVGVDLPESRRKKRIFHVQKQELGLAKKDHGSWGQPAAALAIY